VIAGNHDHPKRLGALSTLLEGLRIFVRPEVRPPGQGGIVRVPSRDGREQAAIAVLPFVPERRVVDACAVMDAEHTWFETYKRRIEEMLAALARDLPADSVTIALAHLLVEGARVGTGERELHLGQAYGVDPQQLPSTVQYVALGHLHRPQEVLAPAKTRYPGSLIELDFGEQDQEKSVVLIEARPRRPPDVELVGVTAGRRLRTVEGTLDDLRGLAGENGADYLRVRVKAGGPSPGLAERVKELLPNALDVSVDHPRAPGPSHPGLVGGRVRLAPGQLFAAYYAHRNQCPPPPELQRLFDQVHEEAAS
jgi:exonuclease SbcD